GNIVDLYASPIALVPHGGTAVAHVEDVAAGIVAAVTKGKAGERYILGGDNLTIAELARWVLRLGGKKRPVLAIPNFIVRALCRLCVWLRLPPPAPLDVLDYATRYWFVDCSKAKRELGYAPRSAGEVLGP